MLEDYYGDRISELSLFLADSDEKSRAERLEQAAREKCKAVATEVRERWMKEKMEDRGQDEAWVQKWRLWYEI